jgi:hypothetical protein
MDKNGKELGKSDIGVDWQVRQRLRFIEQIAF